MASENIAFWWTVILWISVTIVIVVAFAGVLIAQGRARLRLQSEKMSAIEASHKEYVDLFQSVSDIVYVHDRKGRFLNINSSIHALIGLDPSEVIGRTLSELFPSSKAAVESYLLEVASADGQIWGTAPLWSRNLSRMIILEYRCTPERKDGQLVAVRGVARDVTDRVKHEHFVEKSRTKINVLLERERLMKEQLSHFSQETLRAQEEDRLWISRELHDEVGQHLAGVLFNLEAMRTETNRSNEEYDKRIEDTHSIAEGVMERVRKFLAELRPAPIEGIGIRDALGTLTTGFSTRTGIHVSFQKESVLESLTYEQKVALYRAVQECLTNVAKHSKASKVQIRVDTKSDGRILTEVKDDGKGFDPEETVRKGGLGLIGMRERLKLAHGELLIRSTIGRGTTVQILFDVQHD